MEQITLSQLLEQQLNTIQTLKSLLQQERQAVQDRELDGLLDIVNQKKSTIENLALIDKGINAHPDMAELKTPKYQETVDLIKAELEETQKASAVNHEIVTQSLASMDRLSRILVELRDTDVTYDAMANTYGSKQRLSKGFKA